MTYDLLIIGGGPGGYTTALYAVRAGFTCVVLERLSAGGQMATTGIIDNYPGFENGIDGFELGEKMKHSAERFGAVTRLEEVKSLDLNQNPKLIITSEREYKAKAVVLATGANPRELGVPHENELRGRGVSYCATCDGMFYKNKTVVVVGGGNTAVTEALHLSKLCKKVYLVHRREGFRATNNYIEKIENTENIEIVLNSQISQFIFNEKIEGVKLENKKTNEMRQLACEGVFVAVGRIPNSELFKGQIDLNDEGYVIADETTKTNIEGVFAVGDLRDKPLRQIVTATSDGAVAVKYIEEYMSAYTEAVK